MKVVLFETAHETWAPKGMVGEEWCDNEGYRRFLPDKPASDFPWPNGMYLGNKKTRPQREEGECESGDCAKRHQCNSVEDCTGYMRDRE